jgi:Dolichyl-phosphate-mannose-protein mannosyltransferase
VAPGTACSRAATTRTWIISDDLPLIVDPQLGHAPRVAYAERWAAALLLLMAVAMLGTIARKSITNDETVHIPAGYYHLVAGVFHLNSEHPPLAKMWAALPLLLIQPEQPPAADARAATAMELSLIATFRFWLDNVRRFEQISFWTRVPMIAVTIALGWLVFVTTRRLFGERAALLATVLFATEPTLLAHGRAVHTDVPAALAYLAFCLALGASWEAPSLRRATVLGLVSGVALATKFSLCALVGPVLAVSMGAQWWRAGPGAVRRRVAGHALVVAALALLVVNFVYGFQRPPLLPGDVRWVGMQTPAIVDPILRAIAWLSTLLPTYFLFGIYNVAAHDWHGHSAYLLGRYSDRGWWWYFPAAFALKTSLPFLLAALGGLGWGLWAAIRRRRRAAWLLVPPCLLYLALAMTGHINIGVRHLLPAYPFLIILGGAALDMLLRAPRARLLARAAVTGVLLWAGVEAVRAYPDYMTYMNPIARHEPRYRYLSDSNIEWGDEVKELADYLKSRGQTRVRAALLGGWLTLRMYGVELIDLLDRASGEVRTEYVALGASFLNGSTVPGAGPGSGRETNEARLNYFAAYRARTPEKVFAHAIYLYRVDARP